MVENTMFTTELQLVNNGEEEAVNEKFTAVNIDWAFRWFRYITPLEPKYQKLIVQKVIAIIDKLDSEVLKMVEKTISTRFTKMVENEKPTVVEKDSTAVEIDWSFRWFRYITPLEPKYQNLFGACVQEPLILLKVDKCRILNNLTILSRKPTVSVGRGGVYFGFEG